MPSLRSARTIYATKRLCPCPIFYQQAEFIFRIIVSIWRYGTRWIDSRRRRRKRRRQKKRRREESKWLEHGKKSTAKDSQRCNDGGSADNWTESLLQICQRSTLVARRDAEKKRRCLSNRRSHRCFERETSERKRPLPRFSNFYLPVRFGKSK